MASLGRGQRVLNLSYTSTYTRNTQMCVSHESPNTAKLTWRMHNESFF